MVGALQLQELARASEDAADRRAAGAAGAWRERRRGRHRRRARRGLQDRIAQPPVVHRAVPGRRDRRRRHHPRHLHDGRAADRAAELAALRRARRARDAAVCSKASSPASPATATASASRRSAARSRSSRRTPATRSSTSSASASRKASDIIKGVASGVGNSVYYVGAKTGRDGIHGATMASAEFDEKSAEKRPAVQVGDPFMEKLLLEACLEVMQTDALVGIQDMGAAGLTCSTTEMGSRGGAGVEIDVALVPQRETGMTPYEIMLSESQERMLLVAKPGREQEVERIFEKWDLHAVRIGKVTDDGMLRVKERGTVVAEIPNRALTDEAPVYKRPMAEPEYLREAQQLDLDALDRRLKPSRYLPTRARGSAGDTTARCSRCSARRPSPASAGSTASTTTWCAPTPSTCPAWAPGSCASRAPIARWRCRSTATAATAISIRTAARCSPSPKRRATSPAPARARWPRPTASISATPSGRRSCGSSPRRSRVSAPRAARSTCRSPAATSACTTRPTATPIYPTPTIGVVGLLEHADRVVGRRFQESGDAIVLLGEGRGELGGSEYLKVVHGLVRGVPPSLDLKAERALQDLLVALAGERLVRSAHDCSDGGLAVAVAECCFETIGIGAEISIGEVEVARDPRVNVAAALFGESASRVGDFRRARRRDARARAGVGGRRAGAAHRADRREPFADGRRRRDRCRFCRRPRPSGPGRRPSSSTSPSVWPEKHVR